MHIAFVNHTFVPEKSPEALLQIFFTTTDWAEALTAMGPKVTVFLRFHQEADFKKNGVHYRFFKDGGAPRVRPWHSLITYNKKVGQALRLSEPDIIHTHDINFVLPVFFLRKFAPNHIPLIIQDHASLPSKYYKWMQPFLLKNIDGFLFSAPGLEESWIQNNIINNRSKCFFAMENSTHFVFVKRADARIKTGISGAPVFLWVGNLDTNKDPFTILKAFQNILPQLPRARLYMIYRLNEMESEIKNFIQQNEVLSKAVILLGPMKREQMQEHYNSADYFLLGSYKEGSGYSLFESLACGVVPIVTDIPSFNALTGNEAIGGLWTPGNVEELTTKIQEVTARSLQKESEKVLHFFEEYYSFNALAKTVIKIYEEIIRRRQKV